MTLGYIFIEDDMETNSSTFSLEMQDISYILPTMNSRSLLIIDELCRSTSNEDGVALAWSICEHFIAIKAHTLFATHYKQLPLLASIYPSVKIISMRVLPSSTTDGDVNDAVGVIGSHNLKYLFRADEKCNIK